MEDFCKSNRSSSAFTGMPLSHPEPCTSRAFGSFCHQASSRKVSFCYRADELRLSAIAHYGHLFLNLEKLSFRYLRPSHNRSNYSFQQTPTTQYACNSDQYTYTCNAAATHADKARELLVGLQGKFKLDRNRLVIGLASRSRHPGSALWSFSPKWDRKNVAHIL